MVSTSYKVIGVMSGTSLDGIDIAHIHFHYSEQGQWSYQIHECATIPYPKIWRDQLKLAIGFTKEALQQLNIDYTNYLGGVIHTFIKQHQIKNIDAVCSHGHTILHQPQLGYTLQIGNLPNIADLIGEKVVCDFRVQDVQLGGQGAPLVPIGDRLLFAEYDYCLNLGGFSNVSFEENSQRIAFDISPVNTVLNFYANQLGLDYDDQGKISRSGKLHQELFDELNQLAYYQKSYPKSLGFEFVKEIILPLLESFTIPSEDKMRSFTEHIAFQTAVALPHQQGRMLITGGGAYNNFLIERMQFHLPAMALLIPNSKTLEFKEALIFGLLGVLRLRNEINVLSSVTGATADHCSGMIYG